MFMFFAKVLLFFYFHNTTFFVYSMHWVTLLLQYIVLNTDFFLPPVFPVTGFKKSCVVCVRTRFCLYLSGELSKFSWLRNISHSDLLVASILMLWIRHMHMYSPLRLSFKWSTISIRNVFVVFFFKGDTVCGLCSHANMPRRHWWEKFIGPAVKVVYLNLLLAKPTVLTTLHRASHGEVPYLCWQYMRRN